MAAAVSTTRWRDKPIVLEDYDLAVLVPLARRTRGRLVDFVLRGIVVLSNLIEVLR